MNMVEEPSTEVEENPPVVEEKPKQKLDLVEMAVVFLSPALLGKVMILYFGSQYSIYPGRGYGIGLSAAIIFTLGMVGRFIWKYKDYSEE